MKFTHTVKFMLYVRNFELPEWCDVQELIFSHNMKRLMKISYWICGYVMCLS